MSTSNLHRALFLRLLLLSCAMLAAPRLAAQAPRLLSYQGVLADSRRTAVPDADYTVTFRIYDVESGSVPLWEEKNIVRTTDGIFDAILGGSTPLGLPFDRPYWIALQVQGEPEMSPRIRFVATPYAMRAHAADSALRIAADAPGVVHTLSGLDGNLVLIGEGEASVRTWGDTLAVVVPNRLPTNARDGQVIRWNGALNAWEAIDPTISTTARLAGDGSPGAPLDIARMGAADRQPLVWDATLNTWRPGEAGVRTAAPLSGDGSTAAPLGLQPGSAEGQVLRWENGAWKPAEGSITTGTEISGAGTTVDPLRLARQGASDGEVLRWDSNASTWQPGPAVYVVNPPFRGDGSSDDPVGLIDGSVDGQLLYWNGSRWKFTASRGPRDGDLLRWNVANNIWEPTPLEVTGVAPLDRGALWHGDAAGRAAQLPVGGANQVLTVASGMPVWSSSLTVDSLRAGTATIDDDLHVAGTTTLKDDLTVDGKLLVNDSAIFNGPVEFTRFPLLSLPENALLVGDATNRATAAPSTNEEGAVLRQDVGGRPVWSRDLDVASVEADRLHATGNVTVDGDLAVGGTSVNLPAGSVDNDELANSSIAVAYGPGLTGDATVALGGTLAVENTGVVSLSGTPEQVRVDRSNGDVTLSLPQNIDTTATPTFGAIRLNSLTGNSGSDEVMVSRNGIVETRSFSSLNPGGILPMGTSPNATLRWDGTAWIENAGVTADAVGNLATTGAATIGGDLTAGGDATIAGDLTVNGTAANLPAGSVDNAELANASIGVAYGPGVDGDATVALGGTLNVRNTGVTSATAVGSGIGISAATGDITISNTGVTSLSGTPGQVRVDRANGDVTLSLPQNIDTTATPTFGGLTLNNVTGNSGSSEIVVSRNGVVETRSFSSLNPGGVLPAGMSPDATLRWDGTVWAENAGVTADNAGNLTAGGDVTASGNLRAGGDLTVGGTAVELPAGSIDNAELAYSSIGVAYGAGVAGDASVALGGTLSVRSTGVISASAGAGIAVDTVRGDITITNTGVTSLSGTANRVSVDRSAGAVTLSLPQDIHADAVPTFDGLVLDNVTGGSGSQEIVVSNGGTIETRSFGSLNPGGVLPTGSSANTTLRWNGTAWVENTGVTADGSGNMTSTGSVNAGGDVTIGGDLTVNGAGVALPAGSIDNTELAHSTIGVTYGPGVAGSSTVALGGTLNVRNTGVTSASAGAGIAVDTVRGDVTITNTGVTSLGGTPRQVSVSGTTGAVTLSLPQNIDTTATPTFGGITLNNLTGNSGSSEVMVSRNGVVETRSFSSLNPGGMLPVGSSANTTLRWNGTAWVENTGVTADNAGNVTMAGSTAIGGSATVMGNLTVTGTSANLPAGSVGNAELTHSSIGVAYGQGLTGDPSVALGGTLNVRGTGVASAIAGAGIAVDTARGNVTFTNTGVRSLAGTPGQVSVSGATGAVTLALPQNIHADAVPTFNGIVLDSLTGNSTSGQIMVSNNGVVETRPLSSILPAGVLPTGSSTNTTLRWNGSAWVENGGVRADSVGGLTTTGSATLGGNATIAGNLTVSGTAVSLPTGSVDNTELANSSIGVNYGAGVTGSASVALGGTLTIQNSGVTGTSAGPGIGVSGSTGVVTITNTGVTSAIAGAGIGVDTTRGNVTITNTGVTSIIGTPNRVHVSGSTGAVTLTLPQDIHTDAAPTFDGLFLDSLAGNSGASQFVVSNNGTIETRSLSSFLPAGVLPGGSSADATLRWNGATWVENTGVLADSTGGLTTSGLVSVGGDATIGGSATIAGNLTVSGTAASLPVGSVDNTELEHSAIAIVYGAGIDGDKSVALGGTLNVRGTGVTSAVAGAGIAVDTTRGDVTITNAGVTAAAAGAGIALDTTRGNVTITNAGVTSAIAGTGIGVDTTHGNITITNVGVTSAAAGAGIAVDTTHGNVTITNAGVTSLAGTPNQVNVSGTTGAVTLSLPQEIHTDATPTFDGITLDSLTGNSGATQFVVSNNGAIETRPLSSFLPAGVLPAGSTANVTLRWNGATWVENPGVTADSAGGLTTTGNVALGGNTAIAGDLTVSGTTASLPAGSIDNTELANSSIGVTYGAGVTGSASVALGGTLSIQNTGLLGATAGAGINVATAAGNATITNTGVTSAIAGAGITVDTSTGNITITNAGVRSLAGTTNQVNVSGTTGAVTLSLPQNIHAGATPTFNGITLNSLPSSTSDTLLVVSGGAVRSRTVASVASAIGNGFWGATGNSGTTAGTHFIGTTDNQPIEIRVDNGNATATDGRGRVMRFEPNVTSPNIIGGSKLNSVGAGVVGATIAGGGQSGGASSVGASFGTIGGGQNNTVNSSAVYSVIGGGLSNTTGSTYAAIAGGQGNMNNAIHGMIGGGQNNTANIGASHVTIGGGQGNTIDSGAVSATVGGGRANMIDNISIGSTIGGGEENTIRTNVWYGSIAGGRWNSVAGHYSTVAGGRGLTLSGGGSFGFLGANPAGSRDMTISASDVAVFGNTDLWLASNDGAASQLRFYASYSLPGAFPATTKQTSFEAPSFLASDIRYILPDTAGILGDVLSVRAISGTQVTLDWASSGVSSTWKMTGNSGTTPGTHFIGTTDNQAFEIHVNNNSAAAGNGYGRVMRYEPSSMSPNIIGGYKSNGVGGSVIGATIAGGGQNGGANTIRSSFGTIGGGIGNTIDSSAFNAGIGSGNSNLVRPGADYGTIAGGQGNAIGASYTTIGGGTGNAVNVNANYGTIAGGESNTIDSSASWGTIAGGRSNLIDNGTSNATIGGGQSNTIRTGVTHGIIAGGYLNVVAGTGSAVLGGAGLTLNGSHSFGFLGGHSSGLKQMTIGASDVAVFGNTDLWLANNDFSSGQIRFYEPAFTSGAFPDAVTKYTSFEAVPQSADIRYMLPDTAGIVGDVLAVRSVSGTQVTLDWSATASGWTLTGNSGTTPGTHFIGTADNQALEIRVNNGGAAAFNGAGRVMRFEPNNTSPNIIGGFKGNVVGAGVTGSMIAGGGGNGLVQTINANSGFIGGGSGNTINTGAVHGTIAGGATNWIAANAPYGTIAGGQNNTIRSVPYGTIAGGLGNTVGESYGAIGGGTGNAVNLTASYGTIAGGQSNTVDTSASWSTIGGGQSNMIDNSAINAAIGGGYLNLIRTGGTYGSIAGGYQNIVAGSGSSVAGGMALTLNGNYSFGFLGGHTGSPRPMTISASDVAVFGNTDLWLANNDNTPVQLRFYTGQISSGAFPATTKYTSFEAPGVLGADIRYILPDSTGTVGEVLTVKTVSGTQVTLDWSGGVAGWSLTGNSGTTPGTHFIGTVDNQPVEIRVDNANATASNGRGRAMRFEPSNTSPNIIGGFKGNSIAASSFGSTIAGGGRSGAVQTISANNGFIGGGSDNTISSGASNAAIAGGLENTIDTGSAYGAIGGGHENTIDNNVTGGTIAGGGENSIYSGVEYSTIGGGAVNTARADYSVVAGGLSNDVLASAGTIGGGNANEIKVSSAHSTIAGGSTNRIDTNSSYSTIGGGGGNVIHANVERTTIGGGGYNEASSDSSTIGGGVLNTIGQLSAASTIGGGRDNSVDDGSGDAVVGGGVSNEIGANADYSVIAGGYNNLIGNHSTATIGGGYDQSIGDSSDYATIAGGRDNSIGSNADYSTIAGGWGLTLNGNGSFGFLGGNTGSNNMSVSTDDVAVLGNVDLWLANNNNSASQIRFYEPNTATGAFPGSRQFSSFQARAQSADIQYILPNAAGSTGDQLTINAISGTQVTLAWAAASDRALKTDFLTLDGESVLAKFRGLDLGTWRYASDRPGLRHYGIMAQDFNRLFGRDGLGTIGTDTTVNDIDLAGVSYLAIQGLEKRTGAAATAIDSLRSENAGLRTENAELRERIEALEDGAESAEALRLRLERLERLLEETTRQGVR